MLTRISRHAALCVGAMVVITLGSANSAYAVKNSMRPPSFCSQFSLDIKPSVPLQQISLPPAQQCHMGMSNGFPIPDPTCTPGAVNLNLTPYVLRSPAFRSGCIKRRASESQRKLSYAWYALPDQASGKGPVPSCALDRLVPIELGGADRVDNIWPLCGPPGVSLDDPYFKTKDLVESYLVREFKTGQIDLEAAQRGIAADWTQYLAAAKAACTGGKC